MIKSFLYGMIINIQFFTMFPLPMEVPMKRKYMERAVQTFPVLGLLQGIFYAGSLYIMLEMFHFTSLASSLFLWFFLILVTGGIHLDGWMDASDAYFSYRDKNKRLTIMEDPRVGAFAVMSIIIFLAMRLLFIYEIVLNIQPLSYIYIIWIPFLGKIVMGMLLAYGRLAKTKGMASYFRKNLQTYSLWPYPIYIILFLLSMFYWSSILLYPFILMFISTFLLFNLINKKSVQWFNGITGDITGAAVEGTEICLWMIVWLLHYYVMG